MQSATAVVSSTATKLVGRGAPVQGGQRVLIKNTHATDKLVIGGSGVTAGNGYSIPANSSLDLGGFQPGLNLGGPADDLYGIRGGSADITVEMLVLP
jgi:hypothetical protein